MLSKPPDEKSGDVVEVYKALEEVYCDGIGADDDEEKGPFFIAPDIDYPIERGEQEERPAGCIEDIRTCPDDLDDWE